MGATAKDVKIKSKSPVISDPSHVDMNILEYIYTASYPDIMDDDKLMALICNNGWYKQAFCEAHQIDTMTVTFNKQDYKFKSRSDNRWTTLDIFNGKTKVVVINCIVTDSSIKEEPKEDKAKIKDEKVA